MSKHSNLVLTKLVCQSISISELLESLLSEPWKKKGGLKTSSRSSSERTCHNQRTRIPPVSPLILAANDCEVDDDDDDDRKNEEADELAEIDWLDNVRS